MQIAGKVVLITGASRGIGAACARAFLARGATLSLAARDEAALAQVASGQALATAGDLTDAAARERAVARTLERFGRIDILINNAGMGLYAPSWKTPMEDARRLFELNFFVPLAMIQLVTPHMIRQGGGAIVNISSIAGKAPLPWFTLYSSSKYALGALGDGLRMELRRRGIHSMTVCPGYVKTEFQQHVIGGHPPARVLQGRRFAITAERCARDILSGLERGARTVVTPRAGWILLAARALFPALVEARMAAMLDGTE